MHIINRFNSDCSNSQSEKYGGTWKDAGKAFALSTVLSAGTYLAVNGLAYAGDSVISGGANWAEGIKLGNIGIGEIGAEGFNGWIAGKQLMVGESWLGILAGFGGGYGASKLEDSWISTIDNNDLQISTYQQ